VLFRSKVESAPGPAATAAPEAGDLIIILTLGKAAALVNGEQVLLETPAQLIGERTMVPLRFVSSYLGAAIDYDQAERRVTTILAGRVVRLWVDKPVAELDGAPVAIDVPPVIVGGRTLVPVRFIAEAYRADVVYDHVAKRVTVTMADDDATFGTATGLLPGVPHRSALNGSSDIDFYSFPVVPGEVYRVWTHDLDPGTDTIIAVVDPLRGVLWSSDDISPDDPASETAFLAEPGDSYIYVRVQSARPGGAGRGGNYSITFDRAGRELASARQAGPLRVGDAVTGTLSSATDAHWYVFQAEADRFYAITTSGLLGRAPDGRVLEGDTVLALVAPDGKTRLALDDDSSLTEPGASRLVWQAEAAGRIR